MIVIHDTEGQKYLEALVLPNRRGEIGDLRFCQASVLKTLLRDRSVVLCVGPWNFRFLWYSWLSRNNTLVHNTSWPFWCGGGGSDSSAAADALW